MVPKIRCVEAPVSVVGPVSPSSTRAARPTLASRLAWQALAVLALVPWARARVAGPDARAEIVAAPPHVFVILADDMGWGDVGAYNPDSRIPTPHMDAVAAAGARFTDVHSPSAVCTPTRYGLLTGRYCWRTWLQRGVVGGYTPPLIEPDRPTIASFLRDAGYATTLCGKWHLGLSWVRSSGFVPTHADGARLWRGSWQDGKAEDGMDVDFTRPFQGGPVALGFERAFFTAACSTIDGPFCFLDGDRPTVLPTHAVHVDRSLDGDRRPRPGWIADGFVLETVDLEFTRRALAELEARLAEDPGRPCFTYLALSAPHAPWLPPTFAQGTSADGARGDMVRVVDWAVGEVTRGLEQLGVADDTLLIVTSDNGPRVSSGEHRSAGPWRGYKSHVWEGGHRVPFLARWPGRIEAGRVSEEPFELTDLFATVAGLLGRELPSGAAPDSFDVSPALLGEPTEEALREALVSHSENGSFAIRRGRWKLILRTDGSGGWVEPRDRPASDDRPGQLYDLVADPGETRNRFDEEPEVVRELAALLARYRASEGCRLAHVHAPARPVTSAARAPRARPTEGPAGAGRPNVLLVLVDDLGWSDLGCYGNAAVDTPRIDAFRAQGLQFTDAYAAAPVCSPTRASIMTGLAPARLRITNHMPDQRRFWPDDPALLPAECRDRLPLEHVTLAEHLSAAGYRTAFLGKWHLAPQDPETEAGWYPDRQGFDVNVGGNGWGGPGRSFFAPYSFPGLESREEGEYLPYRIGEEAVAYLERHAAREGAAPFFMALWHYTVHWPMDAPADLLAKYEARGTGPGVRDVRYAAMTEALDRVFGQVCDALERTGLADDTLVVFTSDNGALISVADCAPLRQGKGYLYEGGIRVPTLVRWPGVVAAGETCSVPVVSTDLFATILAACGVPLPAGYPGDGVDWGPLLRGARELPRSELCFHYPNYAWHRSNRLGGALRAGRWKLIERFDDGSTELYDLAEDLGEERDLAEERPELAAGLAGRLAAWRERVGAAMPRPAGPR